MTTHERRAAYVSLWIFALAFGWIEASVVVYLREIYAQDAGLGTAAFPNLQVTLVRLPGWILAQEVVREACTMLLLGSVAWLAGRRAADRAGAFLLTFGIWDLAYYAVLNAVLGWPDSLRAWDVLFLIPLPWVAPVWAPATVAALFIGAGSYLYWTSERTRRYGWIDFAILALSALLIVAAFLVESSAAIDNRAPGEFPVGLFWAGVGAGIVWFIRVEGRTGRSDRVDRSRRTFAGAGGAPGAT